MSNYRRLISYIYAYEGGVKGKNIGYAKVEVRGDQCRIQVNVKKVYVGSNDIGVYLLSPGTEIMLGKIFIRGGAGEFRVSVQSGDVEGSGYSMDQCYGLTVHDVESTWQCYTTIWEDAVAQAAELNAGDMAGNAAEENLGDVTEKYAELELADVTAENVRAKEAPAKVPVEPESGDGQSTRFPVSTEIERELSAEDARQSNMAPWEQGAVPEKEKTIGDWLPEAAEETLLSSMENSAERMVEISAGMKDYIGELADSVVEESLEGLQETMMEDSLPMAEIGRFDAGTSVKDTAGMADAAPAKEPPVSSARMMQEAVQQALQALVGGIMTGPEKPAARAEAKPQQEASMEPGMSKTDGQTRPEPIPEPGDPVKLEALDRMEKEAASQNHLWSQLGRRYPKVLAFDYENGCEILSIKPQDIGLLPREVWVYGNNSFLLHGYYNYRHLILARLDNPKGRPRYLLGVPGHYFSNEKYMASMFGFPNFVLAKRQPEADGRYGYWYTDIKI